MICGSLGWCLWGFPWLVSVGFGGVLGGFLLVLVRCSLLYFLVYVGAPFTFDYL
jgi:hypothetical protein